MLLDLSDRAGVDVPVRALLAGNENVRVAVITGFLRDGDYNIPRLWEAAQPSPVLDAHDRARIDAIIPVQWRRRLLAQSVLPRLPLRARRIDLFFAGSTFHMSDQVAAHRQAAIRAAERVAGRVRLAAGLPPWRYFANLGTAKLGLAPFGSGEFTWRDFETVLAGAIPLKPDCSHLRLYGTNFYTNLARFPVAADYSDLDEVADQLLASPTDAAEFSQELRASLLDMTSRPFLGQRVADFVQPLLAGR